MSEPIIQVENLSKRYRLGQFNARTLSEEFQALFRHKRGNRATGNGDARPSEFWALKDVSLEVQRGEVLGVIGRNGAGKSTLLKILSRITQPTSGSALVRGRVASLLEVGTGFHPELTGRENIYLNGAILGMSRAEIKAKFDQVVDFSGVETFLDTPVKRYSSGMYVRLAFAIAAHLEPEILIVDEVLAVGDYEFQRKCIGKMKEVSAGLGRTVIFVSHDLAVVDSLTLRCLLLKDGAVLHCGSTPETLSTYLQSGISHSGVYPSHLQGGQHTRVIKAAVLDEHLSHTSFYNSAKPFRLQVTFETDGTRGMSFDVHISDLRGQRLFFYNTACFDAVALPRSAGTYTANCEFKPLMLATGDYTIDIATSVTNVNYDHYADRVATFSIPHFAPGDNGWDFASSRGFGLVAMTLVDKIDFVASARLQ